MANFGPSWPCTRFKRLSASLHVKGPTRQVVVVWKEFQSPFGITACESAPPRCGPNLSDRFKRLSASLHVKVHRCRDAQSPAVSFKRLSASLHVKARSKTWTRSARLFQTPFGITACERGERKGQDFRISEVSNAFRHHCM